MKTFLQATALLVLKLFLFLSLTGAGYLKADTILEVGLLLANRDHGENFHVIMKNFEKLNPDIKIKVFFYDDTDYKKEIAQWTHNKEGPDVFYWQAGERLFDLANKGAVRDIAPLWNSEEWDSDIPNPLKALVSRDGHIYGLPFAYYQWGFYYKKSLFRRFNLAPPQSWDEFLMLGHSLKNEGFQPVAIGTKEHWPAAAWFDYLDLRINGLDFHRALLQGSISFTDSKVTSVFEYWKKLIDENFFPTMHSSLSWVDAMPYLYREKAGITLLGNFIETQIPHHMRKDIGFFPFPNLKDEMPNYELIPTEVWAISEWSQKVNEAETLMKYLATPDIQYQLAKGLGYIPAKANQDNPLTPLAQKGEQLLQQAAGTLQYLDRDSNQQFAAIAIKILSRFITDPDIEKTTRELEQVRHLLHNRSVKTQPLTH